MQKSYQGLLQTLLYDIFRQCTALIREVCSDNRWAKSGHDSKWSLLELGNILRKISGTNSVIRKFCFFIDGVDEFEGDHEAQTELCRTFKELASSGHIKLVLSSRPWNIFEEQFGLAFPKLYMQDLTREDIQVYTQSSLEEHSRWADLSSNDSQGQLLVSEITERSEGVFLWVRLVTKLLKTGLTNRDKLSDLHRRLRSFPTELEPFFKTMLESVEPFYHNHMSTTLQIALQSGDEPLGFLAYHFHNTEYEDANYAATLPVGLMEARDLEEIKSDISWHLDCRTRGLLEINPRSGIVNFLHRTARDFLETQEMHDFLTAKLDASMDFNPVLSLFKIKVALIKVSPVPNQIERVSFAEYRAIGDSQSNLLDLMRNAMDLAQKLELDAVYEACLRSHLSELDRGFECLLTGSRCTFQPSSLSLVVQRVFREQLVVYGFFDYILMRLNSEPTYVSSVGSLLPLCLLTSGRGKSLNLQKGRGTELLVHILERRSIDLMAPDSFEDSSPWRTLLSYETPEFHNRHENSQKILRFLLDEGFLMPFLRAGADPNDTIYWDGFAPILMWACTRPTALLYTQLCFEYSDQTLERQKMYLDVLEEFLRLSNSGTVKAVCADFALMLSEKAESGLPQQHLPFLSRVNDFLSLNLDKFDSTETRKWQDEVVRKVFPPELYVPRALDQSTRSGQVNRKRKSRLDDMRCIWRKRRYE